MVPTNKEDFVALAKLKAASDKDVIEHISPLLEWLQDCNWPVFTGVVERLSLLNSAIEPYVLEVLDGDDCIWKTNIVGHLIPKLSSEAQIRYNDKLKSLLLNPSQVDYEEGLVDYVEMQLAKKL